MLYARKFGTIAFQKMDRKFFCSMIWYPAQPKKCPRRVQKSFRSSLKNEKVLMLQTKEP